LTIVILFAFWVSPWPGALLIRHVFNQSDQKTLAALEKHVPNTPIAVLPDLQYQKGNSEALLDVYTPKSAVQAHQTLPVVIWTHGGAWVSGDKANDEPYFKLIAAAGFTVVSVDYTLAPEKTYPAQIHELNDAYAYVAANATRLHADSKKIFLAGDSAGSQLSSQMAAIITNPSYAKEVGIIPSLHAGAILFCGIYKMEGLTEPNPLLPQIISWGNDTSTWAYTGTKDKSSPLVRQMSAFYHVTKDFPPTFISGGNGDPLTNAQSVPFADELGLLQVPVTALFYPSSHMPSLPHEYQFNLDTTDGQQAFTRMVQFLRATDRST